MPKILVAECKQEVSSFNPVASQYGDFIVDRGPELLTYHRQVRNEMGGALSIFDAQPDVELVPALSARAITSGGTLAAPDFAQLASEFLGALESAPTVDGAYFCLHGAMAAANEDDPEGYLLEEVRKILGERVPIVVSLDLHGILTDRMIQHSDAIVVYHTYPHVDFYSTGQRAARLLLRIMSGHVKPVTVKVQVPALVRGDELITETGLIRHVIQAAQAIENSEGGLSAGMFWGNPFTDVPDLRSNSLVTVDGDPERAARANRSKRRTVLICASPLSQIAGPIQRTVSVLSTGSRRFRSLLARHPSPLVLSLAKDDKRFPPWFDRLTMTLRQAQGERGDRTWNLRIRY